MLISLREFYPEIKQEKELIDSLIKDFSFTLPAGLSLYHGTPPAGLKEILRTNINGQMHGEFNEDFSFSTSINRNMLQIFSESRFPIGFKFILKHDVKCLSINRWLGYLICGYRHEVELTDEDKVIIDKIIKKYDLTEDKVGDTYLPANFLSDRITDHVDCVCYDYVRKHIQQNKLGGLGNDETEICFVGQGIDRILNNPNACEIWVDIDYNEYNISDPIERQDAIIHLEELIED